MRELIIDFHWFDRYYRDVAHPAHGTYYLDVMMPNNPAPANHADRIPGAFYDGDPMGDMVLYDSTTGLVEHGTRGNFTPLDQYLAAEIVAGRSHSINEARVKLGLTPIPVDIPEPQPAETSPTATTPARSVPTPVSTPVPLAAPTAPAVVPAPDAPHEEHVSFWHEFAKYALLVLELTGRSAASPVVQSAIPAGPARAVVTGIGIADQVIEGVSSGAASSPPP